MRLLPAALLALALAPCSLAGSSVQSRSGSTQRQLDALLREVWEFMLVESPIFASEVGDRRYDDRLPSDGRADHERRLHERKSFLWRLKSLGTGGLNAEGRANHAVLARILGDAIAEAEHGAHRIPITNRSGFHVELPRLPDRLTLDGVAAYQAYARRLSQFDRWAREHVELMRAGLETGWILPRVVLEGYESTIVPHVVDDPEDSLLFAPYRAFPDAVPESRRAELAAAGRRAIEHGVVPGYRRFLAFMRDEYLPAARSTIAASDLPGGAEWYADRVRQFTTLEVTPEEVHATGVSEVARIRAEMEGVIERVGFSGSFAEFLTFLRTDPRFYADTPEELMREVAYVLKRMDGALPRLFGRLPRMPYGIEPIPDYIAPRTTTAYYERPSGDGRKAGVYFVNTHALETRPLYEVEALSLHEAVPGHHLQIALGQELQHLPPVRRYAGFGAFVEGWALYAERLGLEAGFYADPYSDFGRLTYEMWRACRLVVDTGMHAFGWSRERAVEFMRDNTALSEHNIEREVDRYIAWPGQALGYKMGELKIRELRARAERRLGAAFDVRTFHDVVLGSGAVPLDLLERTVDRWLRQAAAGDEPGPGTDVPAVP